MKRILNLLVLSVAFSGCQTTESVSVMGPNSYMITTQAHNIFGGGAPGAEQSANKKALKHCESKNKRLSVKKTRTKFERPYYRNTTLFRCLDVGGRKNQRQTVEKVKIPVKVDWDGIGANLKGIMVIPDLKKWIEVTKDPRVPFEINFSKSGIICKGLSTAKSGSWKPGKQVRGIFSMKCGNGRSMKGTYISPQAGEGMGEGTDDTGANVLYYYGISAS